MICTEKVTIKECLIKYQSIINSKRVTKKSDHKNVKKSINCYKRAGKRCTYRRERNIAKNKAGY